MNVRNGDNLKPIEKILSKEMIWVARNPEHGQGFIIKRHKLGEKYKRCLDDYTILLKSDNLSQTQLSFLSKLILDSRSYWRGKARRLPPNPDFAVRLHRAEQYLDIMMDISNPGWKFFHSSGLKKMKFNTIKLEMQELRHQLFPLAQFNLLWLSIKQIF